MSLDVDNMLLPDCLASRLAALERSSAAAAFPVLQQLGDTEASMGDRHWDSARLTYSNIVDAMAMIRKVAWAACGGYERHYRRADNEFWMKLVERGFWSAQVPEILACYRMHGASMMRCETNEEMVRDGLWEQLFCAHPWIAAPTWTVTRSRRE